MTKTLVRLTAVLVFALCTSACSTIDDLISDDAPATTTPTADSGGFPPDAAPPAQTADNGGNPLAAGTGPTATDNGAAPDAAAAPDNGGVTPASPGAAPDLAAIPEKPSGTTTPDDQREVADSLAADRGRATYSSDALRGGTEAAAQPPGPAPAPGTAVADNSPPPADTTSPPPDSIPPAPSDSTPPPSGGAMPAVAGGPSAAPTTPVASEAVPTYTRPPGSQPAVPAVGGVPGSQAMASNDASLGFRPSTAPALDSSISQFVAQPIIARYQQTASNGGVATGPIAPLDGGSSSNAAVPPTRMGRGRAVGGPEAMTGSVIANFDALNATSTPSVYANAGGLPPTAVVMFPGDGTALSAAGRAQVRMAVTAFQQRGGTGFIKVIGHSSSRTSNMPVEKHLVAIFAKSQARANAVAAEIIREGVPASRVLVEAVGDSQPVYYESMPQGEDGNRRAEIFVQG
jgi:outer membrane protein OmpA-like peptidoglycan-associated protein